MISCFGWGSKNRGGTTKRPRKSTRGAGIWRGSRPCSGRNAGSSRITMAQKSEKVGVVVSDKMQKSIVVAVEWQVRHGLYGKTERRTSKFMVPDEESEAKVGDIVAIIET